MAAANAAAALIWDGAKLALLDQRSLPDAEVWLSPDSAEEVAQAIRCLAVRGAPMIGIAAAYGVALDVTREPGLGTLERAAQTLCNARPTAANLAWAVNRVRTAATLAGPSQMASAARGEAEAIEAQNSAATEIIAASGADLLAGARRLMTHCNTGPLATGGRGTALGVIAELASRDPSVGALVCESRPLLQGARLTVWELRRMKIAHELLVDSAAAGLIQRGEVDGVIVGVDRVAANGDIANKVGTYALALAANAAGIPFVVAGPLSSIDLATPSGQEIEIEERDADEVRRVASTLVTIADTPCRNPAFDVTPAHLITALVTEGGVAKPVNGESVARLFS